MNPNDFTSNFKINAGPAAWSWILVMKNHVQDWNVMMGTSYLPADLRNILHRYLFTSSAIPIQMVDW
jgi:hypothetical protein